MTDGTAPLTHGTTWNALRWHYEEIKAVHLRDLFEKDPGRGTRFVCDAQGIYLDYSKNRLTDDTVRLLLDLANAAGTMPLPVVEQDPGEFHLEARLTAECPRRVAKEKINDA